VEEVGGSGWWYETGIKQRGAEFKIGQSDRTKDGPMGAMYTEVGFTGGHLKLCCVSWTLSYSI
jgi:hypothetical protein